MDDSVSIALERLRRFKEYGRRDEIDRSRTTVAFVDVDQDALKAKILRAKGGKRPRKVK